MMMVEKVMLEKKNQNLWHGPVESFTWTNCFYLAVVPAVKI